MQSPEGHDYAIVFTVSLEPSRDSMIILNAVTFSATIMYHFSICLDNVQIILTF